jgi:hypothetical protein
VEGGVVVQLCPSQITAVDHLRTPLERHSVTADVQALSF